MNILKATKRLTVTTGQVRKLRKDGFVPAILYGGTQNNQNITLEKNLINKIISSESFLSSVIELNVEGTKERVLPREISYDPLSDEPIHIDFVRVAKGSSLFLNIPVKFINSDKSPGLKRGGVLNIVRRKIELKCPAENIPKEIIVDLDNTDIGTSIKISSVTLPENVSPAIRDRDFVIATVAAPTVVIEPEKTTEETAEGETAVEGEVEATETKADDKEQLTKKSTDDKEKVGDKKEKTGEKKEKIPDKKNEAAKKNK